MNRKSLITILGVVAIIFIGTGAYSVSAKKARQAKVATSITSESTALKTVKNSGGEIREIIPHGYVIADKLFFSPLLGVSFTGVLKDLQFENNKFRAGYPGVIEIFQKNSDESVEGAIKQIVKKEGKDPDDCSFDVDYVKENAIVKVKPKKVYEPTEGEIFAARKKEMPEIKTLNDYHTYCADNIMECSWDKDNLIQSYNQKYCSAYAVSIRYHDESFFQFSTGGSYGSNTFLYVHYEVGGGDSHWIDNVHVFPDFHLKSNTL